MSELQGFPYVQTPGTEAAAPVLLLLHGTGGDEHDLLPLGPLLWPGAGLLSPRGKVREGGAARFFRRLAEGVFDLEDLARRTDELARFVTEAQPAGKPIVAVGYSNGANIAANLLLRHPGLLRAAVLLRGLLPDAPPQPLVLTGTDVLILSGRDDPFAPTPRVQALVQALTAAQARVTHHVDAPGHGLTHADVSTAAAWLKELGAL